jgi:hypothetical protein
MKKYGLLFILLLLTIAFLTKPDDKTCIIGGVKAVWGKMMPDPGSSPEFFEQFMDLNSQNVEVKDFIFFKQVKYKVATEAKTVALGAFKKVFPRVKPVEHNPYIPRMPAQKKS